MRLNKLFTVLLLFVVVVLSGCRSGPLYNVDNAPIDTGSAKVKLDDITKAIKNAATGLGWMAKTVKPGHIVATLSVRAHVAVVDIKYSTKTYSITYKDSVELKYDGTNIHSKYNAWVKNLDSRIRLQINSML